MIKLKHRHRKTTNLTIDWRPKLMNKTIRFEDLKTKQEPILSSCPYVTDSEGDIRPIRKEENVDMPKNLYRMPKNK